MIELFALNSSKADTNNETDDEKNAKKVITITVAIVYLVFWFWAVFRALKCSSSTPDSRALHLMFATISPVMYIILSYTVSGFCK